MSGTITAPYLRECFEYQPDGRLVWKERPLSHFVSAHSHGFVNKRQVGRTAGRLNTSGYVVVTVTRDSVPKKLLASRVIWCMHRGEWPREQIDHINRIRTDNRIENLRDVSPAVNSSNKTHTYQKKDRLIGAYKGRNGRGFRSQIMLHGKALHLGVFETALEAHAAFVSATETMRGEGQEYAGKFLKAHGVA